MITGRTHRGGLRASLVAWVCALWVVSLAQSPEALVRDAMLNRDAVKAALAQLKSAQAQAKLMSAYPTTRLETGLGSRPDIQGGEDLTLFQPLDVFGKVNPGRGAAAALLIQAEANLRSAKLSVEQDVLTAYAQFAAAGREASVAEAQLEIVRGVERATKAMVDAKAAPEIQLERASLEVQKYDQTLLDKQAGLEAAAARLSQAVGRNLTPADTVTTPLEAPSAQTQDPASTRPELVTLFQEVKSSRYEAQAARLSLLPDVELQFRRSPWSSGREQYGMRVQFVMPLFDHGAAVARERTARAMAESNQRSYDDLRKRILADIKVAEIQVTATATAVEAYAKLEAGAQNLLSRTTRGYELGASTLLDVLDAQRALYDARQQLSAARLDSDLAIAALVAAKGILIGDTP